MFFFIGGITPKIKKVAELPESCPGCGQSSLYLVRIDHYLNLFFIPLFPVRKGKPFRLCEKCGLEMPDEALSQFEESKISFTGFCPGCGRTVRPEYRFCPFCGRSLN
ncbi:MAG: zinc ribbon domain-containing protein [Candidatus Saccharicenans sp.]